MEADLWSDLSEVVRRAVLNDRNRVHEWLASNRNLRKTVETDEIFPCPSSIFHPQQNVTMGHDLRVMFSAM
jgi:hypothetical protein